MGSLVLDLTRAVVSLTMAGSASGLLSSTVSNKAPNAETAVRSVERGLSEPSAIIHKNSANTQESLHGNWRFIESQNNLYFTTIRLYEDSEDFAKHNGNCAIARELQPCFSSCFCQIASKRISSISHF